MTETTWTKPEAKAADAEYARLTEIAHAAQNAASTIAERAASATGAQMAFVSGGGKGLSLDGRRKLAWDDVLAVGAGELAPRGRGSAERVTELLVAHAAAVADMKAADRAARAWDEANYKGWQRFFLVPGGHIHQSTRCSSLHFTTRIGWLPNLSGETEAEAVAEHGAMLCTKCFPSAPVEYTRGKDADPSICEGRPSADSKPGRRYAYCAECGHHGARTSTGKLRKHKRKVAAG